jgi:hypothetical protein
MATRRGLSAGRSRPAPTVSTSHVQSLIMTLDGITAGDYLAWVRDPEPPALEYGLRSVAINAEPLGELIVCAGYGC